MEGDVGKSVGLTVGVCVGEIDVGCNVWPGVKYIE